MLNILIPMAGRGSRFAKVGYKDPKPLIPIYGKPMIEHIVVNLRPAEEHRFIFVCQREHEDQFQISKRLRAIAPGCEIVYTDGVTEGAACTCLLAKDLINSDSPLMIANSDQWVDLNIDTYLSELKRNRFDGLIMTMAADDPKWSFVRFDGAGKVVEVVEKKVVSNEATVGIYNFARGNEFVAGAESMIQKNLRVNNEFYVAPVYNELIAAGKKIGIFNIGSVGNGMYGLGTPEDLELFLSHPVSSRLKSAAAR